MRGRAFWKHLGAEKEPSKVTWVAGNSAYGRSMMLTVHQARELLADDDDYSDDEMQVILDTLYTLAEACYDSQMSLRDGEVKSGSPGTE